MSDDNRVIVEGKIIMEWNAITLMDTCTTSNYGNSKKKNTLVH